LALEFIGPSGGNVTILGLIDTGADTSILPFDYASLLGYTISSLESSQAQQVLGLAEVHLETESSLAWISGAPQITFTTLPIFIPGALNALWGRRDFLQAFPVAFFEARKEFVVTLGDIET
jgi:hypothetical protein